MVENPCDIRGELVDRLTSPTYRGVPKSLVGRFLWVMGINRNEVTGRSPTTALNHSGDAFDACWPFPGEQGHLGIKLQEATFLHSISIDHGAYEIGTRSMAPRRMILWGLCENSQHCQNATDLTSKSLAEVVHQVSPSATLAKLADFTYDVLRPDSLQTFPVLPSIAAHVGFTILILDVQSNWGHSRLTCLYNLYIHGISTK